MDEAWDLAATLPDGSLTVAAEDPLRAWSQERVHAADVIDAIYLACASLAGVPPEKAARVVRPADIARAHAAADHAKSVRDIIENTEWVEV